MYVDILSSSFPSVFKRSRLEGELKGRLLKEE
jgi:hypothetical protein